MREEERSAAQPSASSKSSTFRNGSTTTAAETTKKQIYRAVGQQHQQQQQQNANESPEAASGGQNGKTTLSKKRENKSAKKNHEPAPLYDGYARNAFRCCAQHTWPRSMCLRLVSWPWFERISLLVIMVNFVTLGMYKPCEDAVCSSTRCQVLHYIDHIIFGFFVIEMLIKTTAMGLFGKKKYLGDAWNRLDFFIIAAGTFEYFVATENLSLSAIRTIRVLRPLRAINRFPSMRILVMLILDTMPMLANVMLLCFFVFFVFGIVGVQMWKGVLRNRCYFDYNRTLMGDLLDGSFESSYYKPEFADSFICSVGDGMTKCTDIPAFVNNSRVCNATIDILLRSNTNESSSSNSTVVSSTTECVNWNYYYSKCRPSDNNPYRGVISFDNIGYACIAIFQIISLESWVTIMYYVQDAHSFWDWIYFIFLIPLGSYFMINLCLVVIATQFSHTKKRETERMKAERVHRKRRLNSSFDTVSIGSQQEPGSCWEELVKFSLQSIRRLRRQINKRLASYRKKTKQKKKKKKQAGTGAAGDATATDNEDTESLTPSARLICNDASHLFHRDYQQAIIDEREHAASLSCLNPLHMQNVQNHFLLYTQCFDNENDLHHSPAQRNGRPLTAATRATKRHARSRSRSSSRSRSKSKLDCRMCKRVRRLVREQQAARQLQLQSQSQPAPQVSEPSTREIKSSKKHHSRNNNNNNNFIPMTSVVSESASSTAALCRFKRVHEITVEFDELECYMWSKELTRRTLAALAAKEQEADRLASRPDDDEAVSSKRTKASVCIELVGKRVKWARSLLRSVIDHKNFQRAILIAILFNTLSMGIEHHDQEEWLTVVVEYTNTVFTVIFFIEMVLKLTAYGPIEYVGNPYNLFDGVIVFISVYEIFKQTIGYEVTTNSSSVSVLRTFRLLRILKLVRFMPAMRRQLVVMLKTFDNVATFFALLLLFIFIFSILGMNLFGCKFCAKHSDGHRVCNRQNFDSLLWASITVFQVLTLVDWNEVLYNGIENTNSWASLYFIALITFGNYVLFNVLVAILVEGFSNQDEPEKPNQDELPTEPPASSKAVRAASFAIPSRSTTYHNSSLIITRSQSYQSITFGIEPLASQQNSILQIPHADDDAAKPAYQRVRKLSLNSSIDRIKQQQMLTCEPCFITAMDGEAAPEITKQIAQVHIQIKKKKKKRKSSRLSRLGSFIKNQCKLPPLPSFLEARIDYSLFVLSRTNKLRMACLYISSRKWFDRLILTFIALNCVTLAMEGPNIRANSFERRFLTNVNHMFTLIFLFETMIKVVADGFYIGEGAVFRSRWNRIDGMLVVMSSMDAIAHIVSKSSPKIFGIMRVFGVTSILRTLRSLRVISRSRSLRLVVQTLLSSFKPIINTVLISCTFFVIFGILGVQLFKGKFFHCVGADLSGVHGKEDCLANAANQWVNTQYNFDDLGNAIVTLFVLASKDGWVQIMYNGIDAVGIDKQPVENYNEWMIVYFISFILLVAFFVLNMFVGVVIENFHKVRAKQESQDKARLAAKRVKLIEIRRKKLSKTPYFMSYSRPRRLLHDVCESKYFDLCIAGVIGINVVSMSVEYYMMPAKLEEILDILNIIFTCIFLLEAIMRLVALGPLRYFRETWNQLDMLIVLSSVFSIVFDKLASRSRIPINPTIIRVMRVLRITRILKLFKIAHGIRSLLETVLRTLPQVANLGLLFVLLFFIFGVLGVELFGKLKCDDPRNSCEGINKHAHFHNFGNAMLTLFRIATGDNWKAIMKDIMESGVLCYDDSLPPNAPQPTICLTYLVGRFYFIVFVLVSQFVLLNVIVAVLMNNLHESENPKVDDDELLDEADKELLNTNANRKTSV